MTITAELPPVDNNDSYMTTDHQQYFRQRLLQWRHRLAVELEQYENRLRTSDQQGGDLIDQSVRDRNKIMDFIDRDRVDNTMRQINAALRRIEDGSYGYCLVSGEEIGLQRLQAYPIATLSVAAQEQLENRQRLATSCV